MPSSQKSAPDCALCGGHGHVGRARVLCCQWSCCPEVPVRDMWPLYAAWVNSWVEAEDASRKMKLKLCLIEASVQPQTAMNRCCAVSTAHGAWVSEDYSLCRCAVVSIVQVPIARCGWYRLPCHKLGWAEGLVPSWERSSNSRCTKVRFSPLEHAWRSARVSGHDAGECAHLCVGSSSVSPVLFC